MAHLNPKEQFERLKENLTPAIQGLFPIVGRKNTLQLDKIWIEDNKSHMDLPEQKEAKLQGKTWAIPVYGSLSLVETATGKVLDKLPKMRLVSLPKITHRFSYILNGTEYQTLTQFLRRPGVYSQVAQNGLLVSQFNLSRSGGVGNFDVQFDPTTRLFTMSYRDSESNIRLFPILQAMGVTEKQLENSWGKEILAANKVGNPSTDFKKLFKFLTKKPYTSDEETITILRHTMDQTELDPETTKITLGSPFKKVEGDTLLKSSQKLLSISRNETPPDDMHSLAFKRTHAIEDFIPDRIRKMSREIKRRVYLNLDKKLNVQGIMSMDILNRPVQTFFTAGSVGLTVPSEQVNPLEMITGQTRTTILGAGGIGSEYQITPEEQTINPSHLGFLDPIVTPENSRIGAVLSLPLGVRKVGTDLVTRVYDMKEGKDVDVKPLDVYENPTVFPDQVTWKDGKPIANSAKIKMAHRGNLDEAPLSSARYVFKNSLGLFSAAANLIPFIQNNMGNRAVTGSRQQEQAISLVHREPPLIQTGASQTQSFEEVLGKYFAGSSPVEGVVEKISKDAVTIRGVDKQSYKVPLYEHYPMNDGKSFLHSELLIKKGDKVKANQVIADNNFTKGGVLSLGTNLHVGYLPFKGYNFEDGIVISEGAAKKLTSNHMHRMDMQIDENILLGKSRFIAYRRKDLPTNLADKLDDDGVIKTGQIVTRGDVLIAALKRRDMAREAALLTRISRGRIAPYKNGALSWDEDYEGRVLDVVKTPKGVTIYVKTMEPSQIGDKLVGRHGNKGVITAVLPDHEMPFTMDANGKERPLDLLFNPAGVPGRVNLGQILETAAAKVAEKDGKRMLVHNFSNTNYVDHVEDLLKKNKISDKELVYDPETKRPLGPVLVGPQYILKLKHQVGSKLMARGKGNDYDINHMPTRGGYQGGQALGALGLYALLAHGAKANLREMATYKSDNNSDYWHAIQSGEPLPPPRTPFTFDKFMSYLRGAGINVHKEGNELVLLPLTDAHVKSLSSGPLANPSMVVRGKDLAPIKGGLFDYLLTGGPEGKKWSHIQLSEPMPNPIFEGAIKSLLGLTDQKFTDLLYGNTGISRDGQMSIDGPIKGGKAFEVLLSNLNVPKMLGKLKEEIQTVPSSRVNELNKRIKILQALDKHKLSPTTYILRNVPVVPPVFRPLTPRPDGSLNTGDLNGLYKNLATVNEKLQSFPESMPAAEKIPLRAALYDGMKALSITGKNIGGKEHTGLINLIAGAGISPKAGFFQSRIISRRQDLTMRSTIVPEPKLGLDEVGIPEEGAWELFRPFIQRRLTTLGLPPLKASDEIKHKTPLARAALDYVTTERPVLMKRDPVLHKFGVMAFKPVIHKGKAIQMHPLVCEGYGADFDGDTVSIFVPLTHEAVMEAHGMFPSNNLFSSTTGRLMNKLSHESLLGAYTLSAWGKPSDKKFATNDAAFAAVRQGTVHPTDIIRIGNAQTTVGRQILAHALPADFQVKGKNVRNSLATDKDFILDKSRLTNVLSELAHQDKYKFSESVSLLNRIGAGYAYSSGFSIGLSDLKPVSKLRDKILQVADLQVQKVRDAGGPIGTQHRDIVKIYDGATQVIEEAAKKHFDASDNNIYKMVRSGARGSWDQFKQMTVAPMLVRNAKGEIIQVPIKKSYSEGLDTAEYWSALHGGRDGIRQKVIGTSEPGAFSKTVMASTVNMLISSHDCGTQHGIFMQAKDSQILGRFLAQPIKLKDRTVPSGTPIDHELLTQLENAKVSKALVRSPLRCEQPHGICAKCYGLNEYGKLHAIGTNIGAMAGHSIGEPATQLALKSFHEGGVAGTKTTKRTDAFTRLNQILEMPKIMPNAAVLAKADGKVSKIEPDPAGGWDVYIGETKHYVPSTRQLGKDIKPGSDLMKGLPLSDGDIHPAELLKLTNVNTVQEYLTNELFQAYQPVGPVKRSNIETVVKAITNLSQVEDPGDHPDFVRGDMVSSSQLVHLNRTSLRGRKPIIFKSVLKPITQLPLDLSTDWLARMNYQRLKGTLVDGSQRGWTSQIHQQHPIPSLAMGSEFGKGTRAAPWLY